MSILSDEQLLKELVGDGFYRYMVSQGVASYKTFVSGILPLVCSSKKELEKNREQCIAQKLFFATKVQQAEQYLASPNIPEEVKDKIKDEMSRAVMFRDGSKKNEGFYNVVIKVIETTPLMIKETSFF